MNEPCGAAGADGTYLDGRKEHAVMPAVVQVQARHVRASFPAHRPLLVLVLWD